MTNEFNPYLRELSELINGKFNAHAHIDRANTYSIKYFEHENVDSLDVSTYPLPIKQNLTGVLHSGLAYTPENLEYRIRNALENMYNLGTTRVDSFVDTTSDIGLRAFNVAMKLKEEFSRKIDFRIGSYPLFGFKADFPERWEVFYEASKKADFIGGLPEIDARENHIGYNEHISRLLELGKQFRKEVHIHVDQGNIPTENGTETLIEIVKSSNISRGQVWAIHSISPSCYSEERFNEMVEGLVEYDIGVIVCPSAAISMRQLREYDVPIHNSVARVLELLAAGVKIRIGTDNINDMYMPFGSPDIIYELHILADAVRFYDLNIWAKLGAGQRLNEEEKIMVSNHLNPN